MGIILDQLGFDVELVTANFGVYDSFHPAQKSAESIGLKHKVLDLDISILEKAVDMIMEDGFPNDGIKYLLSSTEIKSEAWKIEKIFNI